MITWDASELESTSNCKICGGSLKARFSDLGAHAHGPWTLLTCTGCTASWLNPRPTPAAISKAYEPDYPPYGQRLGRPIPRSARARLSRVVTDSHLAATYGYALPATSRRGHAIGRLMPWTTHAAGRLVRNAPAPFGDGRLLDVGCSSGAYVALMRELGWNAHGIELDAEVVARAVNEHKLPIRQGVMTDLNPETDGIFDYITMGHALEHVHDPLACLRVVRSVLAPGGSLWIATPNMASISQRLFRSRWKALDPPRHLVLFTPDALLIALRKAGFAGADTVQPIAAAPWNMAESAKLVGVRRGATAFGFVAGHAVDALAMWRHDVADELAVVAVAT